MDLLAFLKISGYLSFLINLFIGIFVYLKNRKNPINIFFCLFSIVIAFWSIGSSLVNSISDRSAAVSVLRICYLFAVFLPPLYLHFIWLITEQGDNKNKVLFIAYLLSLIISPFVLSGLFIKGLRIMEPYGFLVSMPGPVYYIFIVFFGLGTYLGLSLLYKSIRNSKGGKHNQLKYFFISQLVALLGGYEYFSSVLNIKRFPPLDDYILVVYFLIMAYAILKHRLMDINLALTRAGIFAVVYFPIIFVPFWLGSKFIYTHLWWIPIFLMGVLATLGVFIFNFLRRQAENKLLAEDLKKYAIIERFSAALSRMRDIGLERLCNLILYRLVRIMGISSGAIYLADEDGNRCIPKAVCVPRGIKIEALEELPAENSLVKFITAYRKEFLLDDLDRLSSEPLPGIDYAQVIAQMRRLKAVLIIPSFLENKLFGFLVLGERSVGRLYSKADIEILATLSHSAAMAILNATFALKLKDKERELADKSRIIEIGNLASATGHQLGNVLNNIINFGCGILDNDAILEALKDHPKAMADFDKLVKMIITDAQDGDRIIEEIRGYSRQEGSRELLPVNLKDVLDRTLGLLYLQVNKFQNIDINLNINPDLPQVLASPVGMQNIFVNMLNNSYDSIQEIKAYLQNHPESGLNGYKGRIDINISRSKDRVDIRVSDNGMGMTEDIAKQLFTPNYTTKASIDKRREIKLNGGTGIGLFTIRFLLNDYGGTAKLIRTEPLKGADFLIQLPIPKG